MSGSNGGEHGGVGLELVNSGVGGRLVTHEDEEKRMELELGF